MELTKRRFQSVKRMGGKTNWEQVVKLKECNGVEDVMNVVRQKQFLSILKREEAMDTFAKAENVLRWESWLTNTN